MDDKNKAIVIDEVSPFTPEQWQRWMNHTSNRDRWIREQEEHEE